MEGDTHGHRCPVHAPQAPRSHQLALPSGKMCTQRPRATSAATVRMIGWSVPAPRWRLGGVARAVVCNRLALAKHTPCSHRGSGLAAATEAACCSSHNG